MEQRPAVRFLLSLCCPFPRRHFENCADAVGNPLPIMEHYLQRCGDLAVFPEGFILESMLADAAALAKHFGKWVVLGTEQDAGGRNFEVVIISANGEIVHRHQKTALTDGDLEAGRTPGHDITAVQTSFGVLGTPLCYEIHFPEVARIFALGGATLLLNPIGTGMWHAQQLDEWTSIAKARAIENGAFVAGCTHCCGEIPLAYAFAPDGAQLGRMTHTEGILTVQIDHSNLPARDWMRHRTPENYQMLGKSSCENIPTM